ncbi:MAG: universal stress protein, partial [Candidatus Saccharimonadales bacterium]
MRNILLFIDDADEAQNLGKKALKIAYQCKANLLLCDFVTKQTMVKPAVSDDEGDILLYENEGADMEEFARRLRSAEEAEGMFNPVIDCCEIGDFTPKAIKEMVIKCNIWLIVMDEEQLNRMKNVESGTFALKMMNNINCPVLLMP